MHAETKESESVLDWSQVLANEKRQPYFEALIQKIETLRQSGKVIYPKNSLIFNALRCTPFSEVKVVILGQDPYHGAGQAHGLSFSVEAGIPKPPSLQNIYKELKSDLGIQTPNHGSLAGWARQGALLLNSVLTVEADKPASHANMGWERFTDAIIAAVNQHLTGVVFLLWGAYAQKKGATINADKHLILKSVHPSPLSAHRGFLGCRHFSQANEFLIKNGKAAIDWSQSL